MSQPLWSDINRTPYSSVFTVPPGKVCVLFAAKLQKEKYREDNSDFMSPQAVCVRRLVHDFDQSKFLIRSDCGCCDWIFDVEGYTEEVVADELVGTNCCWMLTKNKNMGIIGVPGTYRLELNDSTAIGEAQVYADLYDAADFPQQVKDLFFS